MNQCTEFYLNSVLTKNYIIQNKVLKISLLPNHSMHTEFHTQKCIHGEKEYTKSQWFWKTWQWGIWLPFEYHLLSSAFSHGFCHSLIP